MFGVHPRDLEDISFRTCSQSNMDQNLTVLNYLIGRCLICSRENNFKIGQRTSTIWRTHGDHGPVRGRKIHPPQHPHRL
jgi:hypothetical protein